MAEKRTPTGRKPIALIREENEKFRKIIDTGIRCVLCDTLKAGDNFYVSTDPDNHTGKVNVCKQCIGKVAVGEDGEPTKETVQRALKLLNKPYLETVWDASVQETENLNSGNVKSNVWAAYIKNIQMGQYNGMTYEDSDHIKKKSQYRKQRDKENLDEFLDEHKGQDTYDSYLKNKEDVIRLLDYDPFEKEAVTDQPFLYAQLLGLLDSSEEQNEDMIRTSSAITIARTFLQISKIDDTIAGLMKDIPNLERNAATIKSLQESKSRMVSSNKDLAAESCLSLKNSKNSIKGENTWTGKIKKIKDMNLREAQVNGFDIATCRGMQQVQEISDASIMKQLALDESEWSDMVAELREKRVELQRELAQYKEINRILLQENLDLKDYCEEQDIPIDMNLINLKDLYSVFADLDSDDEEEAFEDDESE